MVIVGMDTTNNKKRAATSVTTLAMTTPLLPNTSWLLSRKTNLDFR